MIPRLEIDKFKKELTKLETLKVKSGVQNQEEKVETLKKKLKLKLEQNEELLNELRDLKASSKDGKASLEVEGHTSSVKVALALITDTEEWKKVFPEAFVNVPKKECFKFLG